MRIKRAPGRAARLAVYATKLGLPVPDFLRLVQEMASLSCPYCQLGQQVLKHIDKLGDDRAVDLLTRILTAKSNNDAAALENLKAEFNGIS